MLNNVDKITDSCVMPVIRKQVTLAIFSLNVLTANNQSLSKHRTKLNILVGLTVVSRTASRYTESNALLMSITMFISFKCENNIIKMRLQTKFTGWPES